jgi:hypothetical protein
MRISTLRYYLGLFCCKKYDLEVLVRYRNRLLLLLALNLWQAAIRVFWLFGLEFKTIRFDGSFD